MRQPFPAWKAANPAGGLAEKALGGRAPGCANDREAVLHRPPCGRDVAPLDGADRSQDARASAEGPSASWRGRWALLESDAVFVLGAGRAIAPETGPCAPVGIVMASRIFFRPRRPLLHADPKKPCSPPKLASPRGRQTSCPSSLAPLSLPPDSALPRGPGDERGTAAQTPPPRQRTSPPPDMPPRAWSHPGVLRCRSHEAAARTSRSRRWSPRGHLSRTPRNPRTAHPGQCQARPKCRRARPHRPTPLRSEPAPTQARRYGTTVGTAAGRSVRSVRPRSYHPHRGQ